MRFKDRFDPAKRKKSTPTQRIGLAFFWLLVVSYAYFTPTSVANFNTESHLYTAFAIVDHHTLSIDAYQSMLEDKSYWHGHYYSDKAPGIALLAVPVYAALERGFPNHRASGYAKYGKVQYSINQNTAYMRYAITYFLLIVPSALFSVLLWLLLSRFMSRGWSLGLAGAYALGTIAFPYSAWLFSHQLTAILLFSSFMLLFCKTKGVPVDRRMLVLTGVAGLLAGYSVISEYPTVLIAAFVGLYGVAISQRRLLTAGAFALGLVPPALVNLGYDMLAFGKPFATGYMYVHSALYKNHIHGNGLGLTNPLSYGVQAPSLNSIFQISLSSYRGLFFYCPVLLLSFIGGYFMWKRRELRPELVLCAGISILYFVFVASRPENVNGWAGGWSVASRHLTPIVPFMVLPMAFGFERKAFRTVFLCLAAVSVAVMFAIIAGGYGGGLPYGDHNPLIHVVWPRLRSADIEMNWAWMAGLRGYVSVLPYLAVAALLVTRIVWVFRFAQRSEARPATEHVGLELETA